MMASDTDGDQRQQAVEVELKFQVPPAQRAALRRAVADAAVQRTRLQAVYADTADHRLAQAGLALRLRKEGRRWVQTLKGRGDGLLQRLEHEVPVPASAVDARQPLPDPARHVGTGAGANGESEAGKLLKRALGHPARALRLLYRTDITRLHRRVRHAGGVIEIAYDHGRLLAEGRSEAVDEIEFELVSGPPAALAAFAQQWAQRFDLWWDCRTKSERGMRLALGLSTEPAAPVRAVPLQWPGDDGGCAAAAVGAAALHAALRQALPNAAEIASGSGAPEHLHQLRVALRRLRTVLRMWAPWLPDAAAAAALDRAWQAPFAELGRARDVDVRAATLWPKLQAAGAPPMTPPAVQAPADPGACVRGPEFTRLLLQSLAMALQPAPPHSDDTAAAARQTLKAAWRHIVRGIDAFATADAAAQHRMRKRLKRFRYLLEALQPLFKPRPTKRLLKAVRRALDALGDLNDLQAAETVFRDRASAEPRAWFAVGWLSAQQGPALVRASAALTPLKHAPRVWRR